MRSPLKLFLVINALASLAAFTSENVGTRTIVAPLFAAAALACFGCLHRAGTRLPPPWAQSAPLSLRRRTDHPEEPRRAGKIPTRRTPSLP